MHIHLDTKRRRPLTLLILGALRVYQRVCDLIAKGEGGGVKQEEGGGKVGTRLTRRDGGTVLYILRSCGGEYFEFVKRFYILRW